MQLLKLLLFLLLFPSMGAATTYYASPTGSDPTGESADTPASLASVKALATSGDTVYLRGGTYRLASALTFGAANSGVTWTAYPSETPVISGAIHVTGWTLYDAGKNIWKATVPNGTVTRQLYVNGVRATRSYIDGSNFTTNDSGATYVSSNSAMPTFSKPADLEVWSPGYDWAMQMACAASASRVGSTTTLTMDESSTAWNTTNANSSWSSWPSHPYRVENAYEFLTASTPGCWYLDSAANALYYVPKAGEDMATADVELPVATTLVSTVQGNQASNITFSGITFAYTGWTAPTVQKSFLQQQANQYLVKGDWSGITSGYIGNSGSYVWANPGYDQYIAGSMAFPTPAVSIFGAQNVTFSGCTFHHMGGMGIEIGVGSKNCVVDHGTLSDISGNGIKVGDIVSRNPSVSDQVSNNSITNNVITNVANQYYGGVGVFAGFVDHLKINHNEISNLAYTGISLGWGWNPTGYTNSYVNGNEVAYNKIHGVMNYLYDGGGIYSLGVQGSGTPATIHDNYLYDFAVKVATSAKSGGPGAPLYADQGTNYVNYTNNVISKNPSSVCSNWMLLNISANTGTQAINASGNYATSGLQNFISGGMPTNGGTIATPTATTGTAPSGWPSAAQAIVAASGPTAVVVPSTTPHRLVKGGSMSLVQGGTMKLK